MQAHTGVLPGTLIATQERFLANSRLLTVCQRPIVATQPSALHELSQNGYGDLFRRRRTDVDTRRSIDGVYRRCVVPSFPERLL